MNVIITGSNRGIGKAMVEAFAASGANIWACARKSTPEHEAWLKETAKKAGPEAGTGGSSRRTCSGADFLIAQMFG